MTINQRMKPVPCGPRFSAEASSVGKCRFKRQHCFWLGILGLTEGMFKEMLTRGSWSNALWRKIYNVNGIRGVLLIPDKYIWLSKPFAARTRTPLQCKGEKKDGKKDRKRLL
jgi:hypothetical protein